MTRSILVLALALIVVQGVGGKRLSSFLAPSEDSSTKSNERPSDSFGNVVTSISGGNIETAYAAYETGILSASSLAQTIEAKPKRHDDKTTSPKKEKPSSMAAAKAGGIPPVPSTSDSTPNDKVSLKGKKSQSHAATKKVPKIDNDLSGLAEKRKKKKKNKKKSGPDDTMNPPAPSPRPQKQK